MRGIQKRIDEGDTEKDIQIIHTYKCGYDTLKRKEGGKGGSIILMEYCNVSFL